MDSPSLGFKLWIRNFLAKLKISLRKFFSQKLTLLFSAILTIVGIYLAYKGNEISKSSLILAKNDTSQQAQINQLRDILLEIRQQNKIAKEQNDELIDIVIANNNLLANSKTQTGILARQFSLSKKNDSASKTNDVIYTEGELLALRKVFDELKEVPLLSKVMHLYLDKIPDLSALTGIRDILERGLTNRVFLTDSIVKKDWYILYYKIRNAEEEVSVFYGQGLPENRISEMHGLGKRIKDEYFALINPIWHQLDSLEDIFRKRTLR